MSAELQIGMTVARRYVIRRTLGEGGMGTVYLARDQSGEHGDVAIKVLNPRMVGRSDREQRFANEVHYSSFGGRLPQHPNLTTIKDHGRCSSAGPFFVMEYIPGPALGGLRFQRGEALDLPEILRLAYGVALGLVQIHHAGIVHRDITPANVLVPTIDGAQVPKIIDLSHAASVTGPKLCPGEPGRLTSPHEAPGTPGYMAPEQVAHAYPDSSMDIFAYGVVFWELLADRVAFQARERRPYAALQVDSPQGPAPLASVRSELPAKVHRLIDACVAVDPTVRPTAVEIVRELQEFAPMGSSVPSVPATAGPVRDAPPSEAATGRWRMVIGVVALLLLAILAAGVWANITWRSSSGTTPPEGESLGEAPERPAAVRPTTAEPETIQPSRPQEQPVDVTAAEERSEDAVTDEIAKAGRPEVRPAPQRGTRRKSTPRTEVDCASMLRDAERAAGRRRWAKVLKLTRVPRCRAQSPDFVWLRAQALLETKRYDECVALNYSGEHRFARRAIKLCALALSETKGTTTP